MTATRMCNRAEISSTTVQGRNLGTLPSPTHIRCGAVRSPNAAHGDHSHGRVECHPRGRRKVSSHTFICEGVTLEDGVFIGHGVMFTNDLHPRAVNADGSLQTDTDWALMTTLVKRRASIGSNAAILAGITIGEGSMIGAGAVVTRNVPDYAIVAGVRAKVVGRAKDAPVDAR